MAARNKKLSIYSPNSLLRNPIIYLREIVYELFQGHELAWQLMCRDFHAQYRQSFLGFLWEFILPLANAAAWLFIQSTGVVKISDVGIPYSVFVITGTIMWSIFSDAVSTPLQVVTSAKPMLIKINFPRQAIIMAGVYKCFIKSSIKVLVLIGALVILGFYPSWYVISLPLVLLVIILSGTTIGLLLTPIGALYSDIRKGLHLMLQFLMYLTPVVYPMPDSGIAATIFKLNPATPLITTSRDLIVGQPVEQFGSFVVVTAVMMFLFMLSLVIYRVSMPYLIERMGA